MSVKIQIESGLLHNALAAASKVAVAADGSIALAGEGGKLFLHSVGELRRCSIQIPASVSGKDFEFAIPLDALRDATKGREQLNMAWDGTTLSIKCGSYSSDLLTLDPIARDTLDKVDAQEWKVDAEQAAWLKSALNAVALKPTALISAFIPVSVKLTAKGAFVACYDQQHMAFLNSKEATGDLELTMPLDTLMTILDVLDKQAFRMRVSNSRVELKSKLASIVLSLPTMDESITLDAVIGKAKEVASAKGTVLKLSKQDAINYLENARAVIGKERAEVVVQAKDSKTKFQIKTVRGTSTDIVKSQTTKATAFNIDYEYFAELLSKVKGDELELCIVGKAFVSAKSESTYLLVALNQGDSGE